MALSDDMKILKSQANDNIEWDFEEDHNKGCSKFKYAPLPGKALIFCSRCWSHILKNKLYSLSTVRKH